MSLFVQLPGKDGEIHHRVATYENVTVESDPMASVRRYVTGCGSTVHAPAHRMAEADTEPGGARCTEAGCFKPAARMQVAHPLCNRRKAG